MIPNWTSRCQPKINLTSPFFYQKVSSIVLPTVNEECIYSRDMFGRWDHPFDSKKRYRHFSAGEQTSFRFHKYQRGVWRLCDALVLEGVRASERMSLEKPVDDRPLGHNSTKRGSRRC